jgi:hypothetical protein
MERFVAVLCLAATREQAAGFRLIEVPAGADGPVLKGAMWYPCPEAAVLILTNQGGETL